MSTLMSRDIHLTRPSSRVLRAPGGQSTISFGDDEPFPEPAPRPKISSSPFPPAPPANDTMDVVPISQELAPVKALSIEGKVAVVVGGVTEADHIINVLSKALVLNGIHGTITVKASMLEAVPSFVKNLSSTVDVIIAASINNGHVDTSAVHSSLVQMSVSGIPVLPVIVSNESILEAKALFSIAAQQAAKSTGDLLLLKAGDLKFEQAPEDAVEVPPVFSDELLSADDLIKCLRESLKQFGARGIAGLARKFRIADDDKSGHLDLAEFTKVINEHKLGWTTEQIGIVFNYFDSDKSKTITYDEFLFAVRGELNERRRQLVLLAFDILDADKSGIVSISDLKGVYDGSKHPDVIAGKRTADSVLAEFLDTFDTEDKDGNVTPAEFIKYYGGVSASIDDDDYFELMIRNAWHISGGEGWCANTTCRRVLVTHADGHQTVEELKNDLGMKGDDLDAIIEKLKAQGISDVVSVETNSGKKKSAAPAAPAAVEPPLNRTLQNSFNPRRQPGGASTLVLG